MTLQEYKNRAKRTKSINSLLKIAKVHEMPNIPKNPKSIEALRTRVINHIEKIQYVYNDYYARAGENAPVRARVQDYMNRTGITDKVRAIKQVNLIEQESNNLKRLRKQVGDIELTDIGRVGRMLKRNFDNPDNIIKYASKTLLENPMDISEAIKEELDNSYMTTVFENATKNEKIPQAKIDKYMKQYNSGNDIQKIALIREFNANFYLRYASGLDSFTGNVGENIEESFDNSVQSIFRKYL